MTGLRLVVAGWGNPLRGDDGAGRWVAESIAQRWTGQVTTLIDQQPLPEWAAILAEADLVFLVDATADEGVSDLRITALESGERGTLASPHALGASGVITLASTLYGRAPEAFLLEIPGYEFDLREGLSLRTAEVADHAVQWLNRHLHAAIDGDRMPGQLAASLLDSVSWILDSPVETADA